MTILFLTNWQYSSSQFVNIDNWLNGIILKWVWSFWPVKKSQGNRSINWNLFRVRISNQFKWSFSFDLMSTSLSLSLSPPLVNAVQNERQWIPWTMGTNVKMWGLLHAENQNNSAGKRKHLYAIYNGTGELFRGKLRAGVAATQAAEEIRIIVNN